MTKKDYIALANIIKTNTNTVTMYVASTPFINQSIKYNEFMIDLCTLLKSDNPLFNEKQFRKACK